jgi:hypothetical protein
VNTARFRRASALALPPAVPAPAYAASADLAPGIARPSPPLAPPARAVPAPASFPLQSAVASSCSVTAGAVDAQVVSAVETVVERWFRFAACQALACMAVVGTSLLCAGQGVLGRCVGDDRLQRPAAVEDLDDALGGWGVHEEGAAHLLHALEKFNVRGPVCVELCLRPISCGTILSPASAVVSSAMV